MNDKHIVLAVTAVLAATLVGITIAQDVTPWQGEGKLVQSPLALGGGATPAFIMAVDDSGSMTFQTLFPGADGEACWSDNDKSFFSGSGSTTVLRKSGNCDYFYVLPGDRVNDYPRIPPLDSLGFARSPDYNPSYFSPVDTVTYEPWVKGDLSSYGDASLTATRIDPRNASTLNLFSSALNTNYVYRIRDGMFIEPNVSFRWNSENYKTGSSGYVWNRGNENVYFGFQAATFFLKADTTLTGYANLGKVDDACGSGCDMWKYQPTSAAAKQKFANWFSYYGNRNRAMIAGLTQSLKDVNKLDVGYFTINNQVAVTMRSMEVASEKSALYTSIISLPASGGTPNRTAVDHIGEQFQRTGSGAPIKSVCQKNAGMLFTDGFSNEGGPSASPSNADGGMGSPFADTHSNTLADIAASYYLDTAGASPLRADLTAGKVPVPGACSKMPVDKRIDCQANLHMNFYGITLGAKGNLYGKTYGVLADGSTDGATATEEALTASGSPAWEARQDGNASTVDEIWHASMNTRGKYINASTPANITNAMSAVLSAVSASAGQSGSIAVSGARVDTSSLSMSPTFGVDGTDWFGDLEAYGIVYNFGTGNLEPTLKWKASEELPGFDSRSIRFGTTSGGVAKPAVKDFSAANIPLVTDLCANYLSPNTCTARIAALATKAEAINYLRGDTSNAGTGKKLRVRTTLLGDIINSAPVVSSPRDNYGYASLLGTGADASKNDPYDYKGYLDAKKTGASMVFVGANDGMLHAFDGETGVEKFAYIPATAVGYLGNLLFPSTSDFSHRYTVDGPITVSDARFGVSDWRTVLVGTAGAGGRGVFAIDVTTPGSASSEVLWEINDKFGGTTGDRIGHVLGKPVIVPVRAKDGTTSWKAIFGNGYGSTASASGSVYLFVVDIETGAVTTIPAKESSGSVRPNGLGSIVALDRKLVPGGGEAITSGSDGFVDTVYGGDLHGNVWRFDLTDTGSFAVGVGGEPLFTAKDATGKRQPITGGLEAALGPKGGVMVLFGTGSFAFEKSGNTNDKTNSDLQSIYGVLDVGTGTSTLLRGNLQVQTLNTTTNVVSGTDVDYYGTLSGWYLDLNSTTTNSSGATVAAGDRVVGRPRLQGGTFLFPTYSPSSTDPCAGGGTNFLYGLKALTGAGDLGSFRKGPDGTPATEGTGRMALATGSSSPVMDIGIYTTPRSDALAADDDDDEFKKGLDKRLDEARCDVIVQAPGAEALYRWRACGRQSWRQVR